jgi:hypothetical protein
VQAHAAGGDNLGESTSAAANALTVKGTTKAMLRGFGVRCIVQCSLHAANLQSGGRLKMCALPCSWRPCTCTGKMLPLPPLACTYPRRRTLARNADRGLLVAERLAGQEAQLAVRRSKTFAAESVSLVRHEAGLSGGSTVQQLGCLLRSA